MAKIPVKEHGAWIASIPVFGYHLVICAIPLGTVTLIANGLWPDLFPGLWDKVRAADAWIADAPSAARCLLVATIVCSMIAGPCAIIGHLYRRFQASPHLAWGATSTPNRWYRAPVAGSKELAALRKEKQALMKSSADNEGLVKALKEQLSKLTQSSELNEKENEQRLRLVAELKILIGHVQRLSEELDSEAAEDQLTFVLNECAGVATRIMWDALPDKSCAIFLLMYEKMRLVIGGCNGVSEASRRRTFGSGEGFAGAVWQTKQPQICDDVRGDPRFAGPGMQPNSGYRSIIGVPIVDSESRFCGVLNVQSRKTKAFILDSDAELLGLLSSIVSVCLYMNEAKRGRGNGEEG